LNGFTPTFTDFGSDIYQSDIVRSCIHTIASHAAKLNAKHIQRVSSNLKEINDNISKLLTLQPNPNMNAYDFIYKIVGQMLLKSNVFVYIMRNDVGIITGFYPINPYYVEFLEDPAGGLWIKFSFGAGKKVTMAYSDIIHLRRYYIENEIFGDSNSKALLPTLELINTTNQGIVNAVKSSANLRGLLKFTQAMMKPEDIKKQRDEFVKDYMETNNNGGIAAIDAKADYIELKNEPTLADAKQMKIIEDKVYKFYNLNENIVTSKYTEDEFNAFYSSVLEPIAIQLSLEFTAKCFTAGKLGTGHEIIYSAKRLTFANMQSKISMARDLVPLGLFTVNEMREIFELEPVEGGDKRLQSLNFVDADKAADYQGVQGAKGDANLDESDN
jgi:HK97 family phage portal protein